MFTWPVRFVVVATFNISEFVVVLLAVVVCVSLNWPTLAIFFSTSTVSANTECVTSILETFTLSEVIVSVDIFIELILSDITFLEVITSALTLLDETFFVTTFSLRLVKAFVFSLTFCSTALKFVSTPSILFSKWRSLAKAAESW